MLKSLSNSNTTLVKVKLNFINSWLAEPWNSNTTLVKVKCYLKKEITSLGQFKYNTC